MITTALCVSVFVLAVVSLAMLVLLVRVGREANDWEAAAVKESEKGKLALVDLSALRTIYDISCQEAGDREAGLAKDREILRTRAQTLEAELDSQTQAVVALCDAVGLTQEERLDIDLACERAEFHRNRTGDLCEIIRLLGAEDKPFGELRAIVVDLVERKGKLDRYRAAIDAALGGVRRDGASWTHAHVPAINAMKARLAVLAEVEEVLGVHLRDTIADASKYREFASTIKAAQEKAQAIIDAQAQGRLCRSEVHPERIDPDSVVAIQNADGVLL